MIGQIRHKIKKFRANLNLARTLKLIWEVSPKWTLISVCLILLESLVFFVAFFMLKLVINTLSAPSENVPEKVSLVTKYVIAAGSVSILYIIIKSISAYVTEVQAARVSEQIDGKVHKAAVGLDLAFYESPAYFDILKRAKDAGPERPNTIVTNIVDIVKNVMMFFVVGSVLTSIDVLLLPLLALFVLPTLFVQIRFAGKMHVWRQKTTPLERKTTYLSTLITADTSAKEIKGFGLGNYLQSLYLQIRKQLIAEKLQISRRRTANEIITVGLAVGGVFCCIGYIALGAISGRTSVGDITLFMIAFPQSFTIMQALTSSVSKMYNDSIFVNYIFELFDLKPILKETETPVPIPEGPNMGLSIQNLSFTYPHSKVPTLTNVSLTIPPGKIIAVVGLNGAGKTTLIKLLSRLYDPTDGRIAIGDTDIRNFDSGDYRRAVSTVFQDFTRYNVTAADNIRFGDINGTDRPFSDVEKAAINSGASLYIDKFPKGYDTMMGRIFEDGHEVSIGQWQKLAVARAFYSPSKFIILDEATSALDALAEHELFATFRDRIGDRGALVISHRLSAITHADYIYVMAEGRVQQSGTHTELLAMNGDYARLFRAKEEVSKQL